MTAKNRREEPVGDEEDVDPDFMERMRREGEGAEKITAEAVARIHERLAAFLREPVPFRQDDLLRSLGDYVDWRCRTG